MRRDGPMRCNVTVVVAITRPSWCNDAAKAIWLPHSEVAVVTSQSVGSSSSPILTNCVAQPTMMSRWGGRESEEFVRGNECGLPGGFEHHGSGHVVEWVVEQTRVVLVDDNSGRDCVVVHIEAGDEEVVGRASCYVTRVETSGDVVRAYRVEHQRCSYLRPQPRPCLARHPLDHHVHLGSGAAVECEGHAQGDPDDLTVTGLLVDDLGVEYAVGGTRSDGER